MTIIASLVVGSDGSTSLRGNSAALSTQADRSRFLLMHRGAGAIIIGSSTAQADPYRAQKCPVYVFSRRADADISAPLILVHTPDDDAINNAVQRIQAENKSPVVVEAGPSLLLKLINLGLIDSLQLSISPLSGGEHRITIDDLLAQFSIVKREVVDGTELLECRYKGNSTNSK